MPREEEAGGVTPFFKTIEIPNPRKSAEAGRPIFDDMDVCEIRFPGSNNMQPFPATAQSHWEEDDDGHQRIVTYAERFPRQYKQFKSRQSQTRAGTPLDYAPFLTPARRAELRALQVYTVEQLAALDGQELKNLGQGGRDLKNQAESYIATCSSEAVTNQLRAQIEELKMMLIMKKEDEGDPPPKPPEDEPPAPPPPEENGDEDEDDDNGDREEARVAGGSFDLMTTPQLKSYIENYTGHRPVGNPSQQTLIRMAKAAKEGT